MKKALLICAILMMTVLLSGCVIVSLEESGRTKRCYAVCTPSQGAMRVVHIPLAEPRPQSRLLE